MNKVILYTSAYIYVLAFPMWIAFSVIGLLINGIIYYQYYANSEDGGTATLKNVAITEAFITLITLLLWLMSIVALY